MLYLNRNYNCTSVASLQFFFFRAAFQKRLNVGALVMGCGYRGIGHNDQHTVAVYAYCNDAFPKNQVYKLKILTLTLNRINFFVGRDQVP